MTNDKTSSKAEQISVVRESILEFPLPPELESLRLDEFRRKLGKAFNALRRTQDLPPLDDEGILREASATKRAREGGSDD